MKLRFTNTIDDLLALSDYNNQHSPTLRRSLKRYQWGGAITIFWVTMAFMAFLSVSLDLPFAFLLFFPFLYATLFACGAPRRWRKSVRDSIRKLHSEAENKRFFGEHEMEIVPDGLIERTKYNESKIAWGGIERIEATADHTFFFVGSTAAYVIPNKRLLSGDLRAFMEAFRTYYVPDQTLQPPLPLPVARPVVTPVETVPVVQGSKPWYMNP